jgi:UDP-N-acetylmuramate--alanine ligase
LLKDIRRLHFIGIGGYGMSALARVLLHLGYAISGSDLKQSEITEKLALQGAKIYYGHEAQNLGEAQLVVYSTAIPEDNPEIKASKAKGLPIWHRSELLAHFLNGRYGIAIAGAHGKTTTTSMVALVLTHGGLDPTAFIGGVLADFDGNARMGDSHFLVAEADESDYSFLRYRPNIAVVTNIEADHLEHYEDDFSKLLEAYRGFLSNIKPDGSAILNADDSHLPAMHPGHVANIITYGRRPGANFRPSNEEVVGWGTRFTVLQDDDRLGQITLRVPGEHNVDNALATVAVANQIGIPFDRIKTGLEMFRGAKRRFQFLYQQDRVAVVDDYAHHPTEVRATLKAARFGKPSRVIAVFQPHRYNRTHLFMDEFARSFSGADKVFLHKIYSAGEKPIPGVTSAELARRMREYGTDVTQIDDSSDLVEAVLEAVRPGDLVLNMGAGDITEICHTMAKKLSERKDA